MRAMISGHRTSTRRSAKGDAQSAINGQFGQADLGSVDLGCWVFGQQSMSPDIAMAAVFTAGVVAVTAREEAANDAGPIIRPASIQIATTKRMKPFAVTSYSRTTG